MDKDTCYLEVDDIFPFENLELEDVKFVKHSLDKLKVDMENDEVIITTPKQIMNLIIGIIRKYDTYKSMIHTKG